MVIPRGYVPDRGDLIWINFNPQSGREQAGRRPALVLSPAKYNGRVGLALLCPITRHAKGYPFEVPLASSGIEGVVLSDHVKSLDWNLRDAEFVGKAEVAVVRLVLKNIEKLIGE